MSSEGGTEPRWAANGGELFYRDGWGNLIAVTVESAPTFMPGARQALFHAGEYRGFVLHAQYDVGPDGRFLFVRPDSRVARELTVVLGFFEELRQLVPR